MTKLSIRVLTVQRYDAMTNYSSQIFWNEMIFFLFLITQHKDWRSFPFPSITSIPIPLSTVSSASIIPLSDM